MTRHPWPARSLVVASLAASLLAACADRPEPTRLLRAGLHSPPLTLDPHLHDEAVTRSVLGNVYEALTGFDAEMRLVPVLATRWENPNDLTWRLHLRQGARFHDGRPFTAADAVASLERALRHPESKVSGYLVDVASIAAVNAQTIEIVTRRPYPILLNKLAFIAVVPADAPERIEQPVGTGRYRLAAHLPGDVLQLEGFAEHWQGPAPRPHAELRFVGDNGARLESLLAGDLDLVHEVAPADAARLADAPDHRLAARAGLLVLYLHLHVGRPPFDDLRVRQAVDLAVDRERLVAEALAGQGTPASQMVSPQVFGYEPELRPAARDLAVARRLLAEAGYPDGIDLDLEFRVGRDVGPLVVQLAEAGIRARPVAHPWSVMYERLARGEVTLYYGGWSCASGDASDLFDSMVHSREPARGYGDSNFNGYASPELDRLVEAAATLDMTERRQTLRQAMLRLREDLPVVPLAVPWALYGVRRDLAWTPRLDTRVFLWEVADAP